MAEYTPSVIPLGSLADAAAAGAEISYQEQQSTAPIGPGTTTGIIARPEPDWQ
jgi:hypothetical protein